MDLENHKLGWYIKINSDVRNVFFISSLFLVNIKWEFSLFARKELLILINQRDGLINFKVMFMNIHKIGQETTFSEKNKNLRL